MRPTIDPAGIADLLAQAEFRTEGRPGEFPMGGHLVLQVSLRLTTIQQV
jgi:hypothetical protein